MGVIKALMILLAIEACVFLFAAIIYFAIGFFDGGLQAGFRFVAALLYSWFAFVMLGLGAWVVFMVVHRFQRKS